MIKEIEKLGNELSDVFKKHGIEIAEGSFYLKTKPLYRKGDNSIVQPVEIIFDRLIAHTKSRIDDTYDDIWI